MINSKKKGFTIIELVIVIAVIAVLAAVLIPTFSSIVRKSQIAADIQTVRNLNTILKTDAITNGEHKTPHSAYNATKEGGYDVTKISPTADDRYILWNQEVDMFVLVEEGDIIFPEDITVDNEAKLWIPSNTYPSEYAYSTYLMKGYSGTEITGVTSSLDVGSNTGIVNVQYTGTDESLIRTASQYCAFTMTQGTVNHYGIGDTADVQGGVYNLYGKLYGTLSANGGNVVVNEGGDVSAIWIKNANSTITIEKGAKVGKIALSDPSYASNIINNSGEEIEIFEGETDEIGLARFNGGNGTEGNPYIISSGQHISGIDYVVKEKGVSEKKYYELSNDISVNSTRTVQGFNVCVANFWNVALNGNGHTITIDNDETYLFYQVVDAEIKNLNINKLNNPVSVLNSSNVTFNNVDIISGDLDWGNNSSAYCHYTYASDLTFIDCDANFDFSGNGSNSGYNAIFVGQVVAGGANIKNITFTNCTYSGTLISGRAAMFIGNAQAKELNITVTNCVNNGIIQSVYQKNNNYTSGWYEYGVNDSYNHFIANGLSYDDSRLKLTLIVDGVTYTKTDLRSTYQANWPTVSTGSTGSFIYGPNDSQLALEYINNVFEIIQSEYHNSKNITKYKIGITGYANFEEGGGTRFGILFEVDADKFVDGKYITDLSDLEFVDKEWIESHPGGTLSNHAPVEGSGLDFDYNTYTFEGKTYFVVPSSIYDRDIKGDNPIKTDITVTSYTTDANGNDVIVSSANYNK